MTKIVLAGALPPPHIGPTLANEIILNSALTEHYEVIHLDTSLNTDFDSLGRFSWRSLGIAIKSYYSLYRIIRSQRPALLYLQTTQSTLAYIKDSFYVLIASLLGLKVVGHLRGSEFKHWWQNSNWLVKRYVKCMQKRITRQIVLGKNLVPLYADVMPKRRVAVVPNGKNLPATWNPKLSSQFSPPKGEPLTLLFLSNLRSRKGALETLEAFRLLCSITTAPLKLILAGAPRDQEIVTGVADFLHRNPELNIEVPGQVLSEKKWELFCLADIFVFPPTQPEGHPWVLVEALAAGLPVIATDQGAIVESVLHGENGYISTGEAKDIAKYLALLIESPSLREDFSLRSRELYVNAFTEECMVNGLCKVFKQALAEP